MNHERIKSFMRLQEIDQQGSQMALQLVEMPTRPRERHQAAKKPEKNLRQRLRFWTGESGFMKEIWGERELQTVDVSF